SGAPLPNGGRTGGRFAAFRGRSANPGASGDPGGAAVALVPAQPRPGQPGGCRGHLASGGSTRRDRGRLAVPTLGTGYGPGEQEPGNQPLLPSHRPGSPGAIAGQPRPGLGTAQSVSGRPAAVGVVLSRATVPGRSGPLPRPGRGQQRGVQPR